MRFLIGFVALTLLAQDPTVRSLIQDGLFALKDENWDLARTKLEAASKLEPNDGRIWLGLAEAYRQAEDAARAEDAIVRAGELSDENPELLRGLAIYFDKAGEPDRAAKAAAQYARNYPDDPEPFEQTAKYFLQAGQPQMAVEFALSALERRQSGETYNILGNARVRQGDLDEGIDALRKAVELDRYDEDLHVDLGQALLDAGRFDEALEAFQEGRKVFDKSERINLGLGLAADGLASRASAEPEPAKTR